MIIIIFPDTIPPEGTGEKEEDGHMTFMNPYGYIILFILYRIGLGVLGKHLYKKYDLNGGFFWGFLLGIIGFLYVGIRVLFRKREIAKTHARSAAIKARAEQEALEEKQ